MRDALSSRAGAWLLVRMSAWAAILPVLKYVMPLPRLVRLAHARASADGRSARRERQIVALGQWLYAPVFSADLVCVQRSLLIYRFLGQAGARPELLVGVRKHEGVVRGHAWVTVDGEPVGESGASVAEFTPAVVFESDGTARAFTQADSRTASGMNVYSVRGTHATGGEHAR